MPVVDNTTNPGYYYDEWPCDPTWGAPYSTYCPTITGDNAWGGGIVIGYPDYSIEYAGDTTLANGDPPCFYTSVPALTSQGVLPFCTQILNFWEDDTGDTTDELYQTIVALQGSTIILDTGVIDWGTNGDGTGNPAENFEWIDVLFGTFGQTGVNNGMCLKANSIYAVGNEGPYWQYASAKTCGQPVPGAATVTVTTYTGPPSANSEVPGKGKDTTKIKSVVQKFTIFFTDDYETYF